jgi:hypothetical protein
MEPAVNTGAIFTSVVAIVGVVKLLWPTLVSEGIWDFIFYAIALLLPIITAIRIRGKVWSPSSVSEVLKEAIDAAEKTNKK